MNNSMPTPHLENYEGISKSFDWDNVRKEFSFRTTGKVNYAFEITDYQVAQGRGKKAAIISQKPTGEVESITFEELARNTNAVAANLAAAGLRPGDRFGIYASKSIQYVTMMLAAIKCGAIAVPLFEAFGTDAIADRLRDCEARWLYVKDTLMKNVDFPRLPHITDVISDGARGAPLPDITLHSLGDLGRGTADASVISFGDLETPFIIHYTSGSTAKPKGILLAQRAMLGHLVTAKYVLDLHPEDKYWNSGDPGWVTGMVYNFFAPLLLGVAAHIYEGPFNALAWVNFMARHKISVWYSTPTAFRLLRYYGVPMNREKLPRLRHIVSAGEPLNPALIDWTQENLGIPIYDSWYMTENGHQLINNYRSVPIRKGSMGKTLPGIRAAILDDTGNEAPKGQVGRLAIKAPWPGLMKTVWNNPKRYEEYFENGWYISGDSAYEDKDGYFWFQGREDDMIKSAAERISPFEIESTLVSHPAIAEAGVIGKPHDLYGNIVKAFVLLKPGVQGTPALHHDIVRFVREKLAVHEVPREIEFVATLPKTRSGKIMRRVLRARESHTALGDLSTMDVEMNPVKK